MTKGEQFLIDTKEYLDTHTKRDFLWAILFGLISIRISMAGSMWCIAPALAMLFNLYPYMIPWYCYEAYAKEMDEEEE